MDISITHFKTFDVMTANGDLTLNALFNLTSQLSRLMLEHPDRDCALDITNAAIIEPSVVKFFTNAKKRKEEQNGKLFLIKPVESIVSILQSINALDILPMLNSSDELENQAGEKRRSMLLNHTTEENGQHRLKALCPACGSERVAGYLLDLNSYDWKWFEDDPFPISTIKGTEDYFDVFGLLPLICIDCFMASITVSDFTILHDKTPVSKSTLDENSRHLLSKSIKKRRDIISSRNIDPESAFFNPRNKDTSLIALSMAELCSRTLAVNKKTSDPYTVGFLNYLMIRYAEDDSKDELIDNCRTWFTQSLVQHEPLTPGRLAIAYFVLIVSDINLGKTKEAAIAFNQFTTLAEAQAGEVAVAPFISPKFWYSQAERLWQKDVDEKTKPYTPG
jgi:hypothetical protein